MVKKLLLIIFIFSAKLSYSQGTAGKDFWVGFMAHDWYCYYNYNYWGHDTLELFISSVHPAKVRVQAPGHNYDTSLTLTPNMTSMVRLPSSAVCRFSDSITYDGVHVTADTTINVYAVNRFWYSKGATVVIPTESITNSPEYFVTTNEDNWNWGWSCNGKSFRSAEFVIVGIADSSVIEVVPTGASTRYSVPNTPFLVTLKKGQTFQYMTTDADLTGSVVRSKYEFSKFAVFAGNRMTFTNQYNGSSQCWSSWDHTYEQMTPTVTWGQNYTAMPFDRNPGGYYFKVVAAENNTRVKINGSYYTTINQGGYFTYNILTDSVTTINADKRISVAQFAKGITCSKHPKTYMGDPAQVQLFPDEQFGTNATINTVSITYWWWWNNNWWWQQLAPEHYINIMVKALDTATFSIDGNHLQSSDWQQSKLMKGYRYAQVQIDSGSHYMNNPKGFLAYVYGYAPWEGYAYAAAANFKPIQNNYIIKHAQCVYDTVIFSAIKNDSFGNYTWKYGDNSPMGAGKEVIHVYKDTGWYSVVMYTRQIRTNMLDSVTKDIYIARADQTPLFDPDTSICGPVNIIVVAKNFQIDKVYYWNDGHPNYYRAIKGPGQYWLRVTERNGCTFTDTLNIANYRYPRADFKATDSVFCMNKSRPITFTNLSTSPDPVKEYKWDFGDLNVIDSNKIVIHQYQAPDKYLVSLRVKTIYGCVHDTFKIVDVIPAPLASFSITNLDSCFKTNTISLKNNTVVDPNEHKRYKWYFSEGYVISNNNPAGPRTYTNPGKYYIDLIYENKNGCIDTMKKTVIIYNNPVAGFNIANQYKCLKDTLSFINKTTSVYKPVSFKWSLGDGNTSTDSCPKHIYPAKGSYTVKLVTTSPQGCKDSASKIFKVYGSPAAAFSLDDTTACYVNNNFNMHNLSTTDTGGFSLRLWQYSDGLQDKDVDNPVKHFSSAGKHRIKLKVVNIFGCADSISKTIYTKLGPTVNFNVNDLSQCFESQSFDFNYVQQIQNDSISRLTWFYDGDSTVNQNNLSGITFPKYGKYPVTLRLYTKYGCAGQTIKTVIVNSRPISAFSVQPDIQCFNGHQFNIVNQSLNPNGSIASYNWDLGDNSGFATANPPPKKYAATGYYNITLKVVSDSGCTDSSGKTLQLNPNPRIDVAAVADVCEGDTTIFIANVILSKGTIVRYDWDFGDFTTSDQQNPRHRYNQAGLYNITLTATTDKNCKDFKLFNNWARVNPAPKADFSYEVEQNSQNSTAITFTDLTTPQAAVRFWDFGSFGKSTLPDTSVEISDTATIPVKLYVEDHNGCKGYIYKNIFASAPAMLYFPTAFSPNNDGINDGFGPRGILFAKEYSFKIFNRWGELVFSTNKTGQLWDGKYRNVLCPQDAYIYLIDLRDFNGKRKNYEGSVTLLR